MRLMYSPFSPLSLARMCRLKKGEPRRLYTYALLDALDAPYAVFRFNFGSGWCDNVFPPITAVADQEEEEEEKEKEEVKEDEEEEEPLLLPPTTATIRRRLSLPPSTPLQPSTTSSEPCSPVKKPFPGHLFAATSSSSLPDAHAPDGLRAEGGILRKDRLMGGVLRDVIRSALWRRRGGL